MGLQGFEGIGLPVSAAGIVGSIEIESVRSLLGNNYR
jgi:hypothetical protein